MVVLTGTVNSVHNALGKVSLNVAEVHCPRKSGVVDHILIYVPVSKSFEIGRAYNFMASLRRIKIDESGRTQLGLYFISATPLSELIEPSLAQTNLVIEEATIKEVKPMRISRTRNMRVTNLVVSRQSSTGTETFTVVAFCKLARIARDLKPGTRILLTGRLQSRTYRKRYGDVVHVHEITEVALSKLEVLS